ICLVCHQSNEPFKPNDLRHVGAISHEWKMATTPHAPHLARGVQCQTCHRAVFGGPSALEDGHNACGECHESKARPAMDPCRSCHAWYTEQHEVVAMGPWSTKARFKHDQRHFIQCEFCHRSNNAPDLTAPTMEECARCHEPGQPAAKLKV